MPEPLSSALTSWSPNTVQARIPGMSESSVPSANSHTLMRIAPAITFCTTKGGVGIMLAAKVASTPCALTGFAAASSASPAIRRTVSRLSTRPAP